VDFEAGIYCRRFECGRSWNPGLCHVPNQEAIRRSCSEDARSPEEILTVVAGEKARLMYENGDLDGSIISCGQGIGLVHDIPTVKELFERIIGGASKIVKGFQDQAGELGW
jgi:hypothetical protein